MAVDADAADGDEDDIEGAAADDAARGWGGTDSEAEGGRCEGAEGVGSDGS